MKKQKILATRFHLFFHFKILLIVALIIINTMQVNAVKYETPIPPGIPKLRIIISKDCSVLEQFAARELRRYIYLRTGSLLNIETTTDSLPEWGDIIALGTKYRPFIKQLAMDGWVEAQLIGLESQCYIARKIDKVDRKIQLLAGGDDVGALYAAYRFIENTGVRFYLHGDQLPEERLVISSRDSGPQKGAELLMGQKKVSAEELQFFNEIKKPLFNLRGIQPFHDFPEGPDWWNYDDYMAIISQLPKLRMNFIGLHTYPENRPNAEPTVWIGLSEDVDENGNVKFAYPASYQNTLRGKWGYKSKKTGDYSFGAANLFERDDYGSEVMWGLMPEPTEPEKCIEIFNRTGDLFKKTFEFAHRLGVKTCVGTETPLVIPAIVSNKIKSKGKDPSNMEVVEELYTGIFNRITKAYPIDYYWFWTPEDWTWKGAKPQELTNTINDLFVAINAHTKVKPFFELATCGWVLGPQQDRALFDKILPKNIALSC
ncbi:MAG TPA: hypothetical protein PLW02_02535, partial [Verrucomicrobiota bacterium]|nr:hypothetical protein [Verrucomicrobiota bacterium]